MEFDITYLPFPLTLAGCALLAVAGLGCLLYCKGSNRRHLAWAAAVFLAALVLYFGGLILLGCFQMTWRNWMSLALCGVLLLSGWAGIILTMACLLPRRWPSKG